MTNHYNSIHRFVIFSDDLWHKPGDNQIWRLINRLINHLLQCTSKCPARTEFVCGTSPIARHCGWSPWTQASSQARWPLVKRCASKGPTIARAVETTCTCAPSSAPCWWWDAAPNSSRHEMGELVHGSWEMTIVQWGRYEDSWEHDEPWTSIMKLGGRNNYVAMLPYFQICSVKPRHSRTSHAATLWPWWVWTNTSCGSPYIGCALKHGGSIQQDTEIDVMDVSVSIVVMCCI